MLAGYVCAAVRCGVSLSLCLSVCFCLCLSVVLALDQDLKPENILLVSNEYDVHQRLSSSGSGRLKDWKIPKSSRIKLIDFGSATYDDQVLSLSLSLSLSRARALALSLFLFLCLCLSVSLLL